MPIQYGRDDEHCRLRVTLTGPLTLADLIAVVDFQIAEGLWTYGLLYDTRGLSFPPSSEESHAILNHVRTKAALHGPRGAVAVVARAASIVGAAQMYAVRSGQDLRMQVFWDVDEAEQWLDSKP